MIYLRLLWTFFKIGLFTIGGGYAMLPLIKSDVINVGWLTLEELDDFIGISESTPGPFAINIATFIGYNQGGFFGAFCATLGVVLPSFIIIIIVAKIINKFLNNKYVNYALTGIRPVVVGLILSVAVNLIIDLVILKDQTEIVGFGWQSLIIMGIVFILSRFKKLNKPVFLILISAILGILMFGVFGL